MTHVLHVFDSVHAARDTGLLADAVADLQVFDQAPECVTAAQWAAAACVLVEADAVDQLVRQHVPRRRRVVVIVHDLDDASIYARSVAIGAELVVTLPDGAHIVAKTIRDAFHPAA
jgi:succinyl-CoA synthetase alpha subunit